MNKSNRNGTKDFNKKSNLPKKAIISAAATIGIIGSNNSSILPI